MEEVHSREHFVDHQSKAVDIALWTIRLLEKDVGSGVQRRSLRRESLHFEKIVADDPSSQTKVSNFDYVVVGKHNVLQFKVAMHVL